jgi:hypothetical protein
VQVSGAVNTGIAIANPNTQQVTISFSFDDGAGGSFTIPAGQQIAQFLSQAPFNAGAAARSLTIEASAPVAVIALRGLTNERGEFLMTTLPVTDLSSTAVSGVIIPHYAQGGGWTTEIVLVNPSDSAIGGSVRFGGSSPSIQTYSIAARSAATIRPPAAGSSIQTGLVEVAPSAGTPAPSSFAIFSFSAGGVVVTEASVPANPLGTAFRLYSETSPDGSIQTGFAIANPTSLAVTVTIDAANSASIVVPANGQVAMFVDQIPGLRFASQGEIRISAPSSIALIGLRARTTGDRFLITTLSPSNESAPLTDTELFFPHLADGGGYTTEFIIFGQPSRSTLRLLSQSGVPLIVF